MTTTQIITTIFEIAAVGFIVWGFFNEHKLINFENKILEVIRRKW